MKQRSLGELLDKLVVIKKNYQSFYDSSWMPWFNKAQEEFWGTINGNKCIFEVHQERYSVGTPSSPTKDTLILPDNQLPLAISDPYYDKDIIEKRLKGSIKGLHKRAP